MNYRLARRSETALRFFAMFRHIWDFSVAVISNWVALAGGFVGVVIGVYEKYQKRSFVGSPFWYAMAATVLIACFWAWLDERQQIEKLHLDKISMTPRELVRIFDGRTSAQGETFSVTYTGKWIEVSGTISDVEFYPDGLFWKRARVTMADKETNKDTLIIVASFATKWTEPLKALQPGEKIKALGRIDKLRDRFIGLENCDLIEVVRPTPHPSSTPTS